jgi:hypothetical protein
MKFFYHYYCTFYKGKNFIQHSGTYTETKKIDSVERYEIFCNDIVDHVRKNGQNVSRKDLIIASLNLLHVEGNTIVELPEFNVTIPGKGV